MGPKYQNGLFVVDTDRGQLVSQGFVDETRMIFVLVGEIH